MRNSNPHIGLMPRPRVSAPRSESAAAGSCRDWSGAQRGVARRSVEPNADGEGPHFGKLALRSLPATTHRSE